MRRALPVLAGLGKEFPFQSFFLPEDARNLLASFLLTEPLNRAIC